MGISSQVSSRVARFSARVRVKPPRGKRENQEASPPPPPFPTRGRKKARRRVTLSRKCACIMCVRV